MNCYSLKTRVNKRARALDRSINRGTGATEAQAIIELLVHLCEACFELLRSEDNASHEQLQLLIELIALLSHHFEDRAQVCEVKQDGCLWSVIGVSLSTEPSVILRTHTSLVNALTGTNRIEPTWLLVDETEPGPLVQLDRHRAATFLPGLYALVEQEAIDLSGGGDTNWGDDYGEGDPHWHPDNLPVRMATLRSEADMLINALPKQSTEQTINDNQKG